MRAAITLRLSTIAALGLMSAATASSQQQPVLGRVDGVVIDSIHATALAGALVFLSRRTTDAPVSRSATTDAQGRFAFDSLPAGSYVVALETSLLDSLELTVPPSAITVAGGASTNIRLFAPSGTTLRTLVCPAALLPAGIGALMGEVRDARGDQPLHGVTLTVGWTLTTVDPATLRTTNVPQSASVESDSLGRFLVCGVPTDTYLDLRASLIEYKQALLQVVIPEDVGVARQNLAIGEVEVAGTNGAAADGAGIASIVGSVYGASAALAGVQVQRLGDSTVSTTDSLGRFRLGAVPVGTHTLELRRVGYLPRQLIVEARAGSNLAPDVHLTRIVTLDSVRVVAQRSGFREFESRARAAAFGDFLRAEDIERKHPHLTSDLLRHMPDFVIWRDSTSDLDVHVYQSGGPTSWTTKKPCEANIVIDGVPHQMINWVDPKSIGAMEIYRGVATGPIQYRSACGTILIWTKTHW